MNNHQPFDTVGEEGYLSLMSNILKNGYNVDKERTGTGTIVNPTPAQLHFPNVGENFPLITTKYVSFNMLACEMLWFISGSTNANDLGEIGSDAMADQWMKWADEDGELGPVYGKQWRNWYSWQHEGRKFDEEVSKKFSTKGRLETIDQLQNVIDNIKENPESRRHIVSAWNPADLEDMALPPCHLMYQFTCEPIPTTQRLKLTDKVDKEDIDIKESFPTWGALCDHVGIPKYKLHLHLTQRSCDIFLGVPFNIAEYALLLLLVSKVTNTIPGDFTWTGVNCHIYQNHLDAVKEQLSRDPYHYPKVIIHGGSDSIDEFQRNDITLSSYSYHPAIKAEVSV